jgi:hypothetical protein
VSKSSFGAKNGFSPTFPTTCMMTSKEARRKLWKKREAKKLLSEAKKKAPQRRLRILLGLHTLQKGVEESSKTFLVNPVMAKYWKSKLVDPMFHPGSHGGAR